MRNILQRAGPSHKRKKCPDQNVNSNLVKKKNLKKEKCIRLIMTHTSQKKNTPVTIVAENSIEAK